MPNTLFESLDAVADQRLVGSTRRRFRTVLQYVVQAPSSHNTQPWLFHLQGDALELRADRRRALRVVDPLDRELIVSCGAALYYLRVALKHFGFEPEVELLPSATDNDLLARVRMGTPCTPTPEDEMLFEAIALRHTQRGQFEDRPLPNALLQSLAAIAKAEGVWLETLDERQREAAGELIASATRAQAADPAFRHELAGLFRANDGRANDGMPGYAHGLGAFTARVAPIVIDHVNWGEAQGAKDRALATGAPALIVIGTLADTPSGWLKTGQALAAVLLAAVAAGVSASFLNQAIEIPALRRTMMRRLDLPGVPQLVLRMGYGPLARATPRRSVDEVLTPY